MTRHSVETCHSTAPISASDITRSLTRAVAALPLRLIHTLATWQKRIQDRAHLAQFDEYRLRDIGLSRPEALREFNKPFWRG